MVTLIKKPQLENPSLVAAWPGMGMVAYNAVNYLKNKLQATSLAKLDSDDYFAPTSANVEKQVIRPLKKPENKFYYHKSADGKSDILFFIGNVQPIPHLEYRFAREIINTARTYGIQRVYTTAAAPSDMDIGVKPRVFAAPNSRVLLRDLVDYSVHFMGDGSIAGLNGLLISVAREMEIDGICLLGEIPFFTAQIEFPRASLEVLSVLADLLHVSIDMVDLELYADSKDREIKALASQLTKMPRNSENTEQNEGVLPGKGDSVDSTVRTSIENLFRQAEFDQTYKSKMRLKEELDRHELFDEYLDRFLDLFKKSKDQR